MRLHVNFKGCESVKRQRGGGGECTEMVGKWDGTCRKPRWSIYRYAQDVEQAVDESEDQVELKGRAFERGNIVNPGVLGRKNLCVRKCNLRRAWKRRKLWSNVTYMYKTVCTYLYMAYIYIYVFACDKDTWRTISMNLYPYHVSTTFHWILTTRIPFLFQFI